MGCRLRYSERLPVLPGNLPHLRGLKWNVEPTSNCALPRSDSSFARNCKSRFRVSVSMRFIAFQGEACSTVFFPARKKPD